MDDKIKILLDKINIDEKSYQYFSSAVLTKIKINSKKNSWIVYIDIDNLLPIDLYEEVESKKNLLDKNASSIDIVYNVKNKNLELYKNYYSTVLNSLKKELKAPELYEDCMNIQDGKLILIVSNSQEQMKLEKVFPKIKKFYKRLSYDENIEIIINHHNDVQEAIQHELENIEVEVSNKKEKDKEKEAVVKEKKQYRRAPKDENSIFGGHAIKEKPIKIKTIIGEDGDVVVEAKVFGLDFYFYIF